jgi:hypothetical protein
MGVVKRVIVGAVRRDVRRRKDILANVKFYNRADKGCGFLRGCKERVDEQERSSGDGTQIRRKQPRHSDVILFL